MEEALAALAAAGLQSDERFAAAHARARVAAGYGPHRIRQELGRRGVDAGVAARALAPWHEEWSALAEQARRKRFGAAPASGLRERARQARFLQHRGFSSEQLRHALPDD